MAPVTKANGEDTMFTKEDIEKDMIIRFGSPNGEKSLGKVVRVNRKTVSVVQMSDARGTSRKRSKGTNWRVPWRCIAEIIDEDGEMSVKEAKKEAGFFVGQEVIIGRGNGEKTRSKVIKVNRKSIKVKTLEKRGTKRIRPVGTEWRVDKSLATPVED